MALDPTSQNRAAIANGIRSVLPSSSPLGKSLEENERLEQEQLAVDEANNLVMQRDEAQLPVEAQGFVNPGITSPSRETASVEDQYLVPSSSAPAQSQSAPQAYSPNYMQNAANLETDVAQRAGKLEGDAYNQIANGDQEYSRQLQEVQKQQIAAEDAWKQEYDSLKKDVDSKKIDQRKWWNDKSTGDKVLTMIGMAFASMSNDSFKAAMGAIDKTIERDINAQRSDIENGRMKLQDSKTLYAENLRRFGDQKVALASTRLMNAETIKNRLQAQMSGLKGDVAKANGMKMMAQVEQYQNKHALEVQKTLREMGKEQRELGVNGYSGAAPDATSARQFRDASVATSRIKDKIKQLKELSTRGGRSLSPQARAEAEEAIGTIMAQYKSMEALGTLDAGVERLMEKFVNNPTDIFSTTAGSLKKLDEFEKSINAGMKKKADILGLTPLSNNITSFRPNK